MNETSEQSTCRARVRGDAFCKRRTAHASNYCWQHSRGIRSRWSALTNNQTVVFVLTVIGLPLGLSWAAAPFVLGKLPGPRVYAYVNAMYVSGGNADGCAAYKIQVVGPPDDTIEQLHITLQLPADIADFKFGAPPTFEIGGSRNVLAAFNIGRDANGECSVLAATTLQSPDISIDRMGPGTIEIRGNTVYSKAEALGMFALSSKHTSFHPAVPFEDGSYSYKRLGYSISRPVKFENGDPVIMK